MPVTVLSAAAAKLPRTVTVRSSSSGSAAENPWATTSNVPAIRPGSASVIVTHPASPWYQPSGRSTVPGMKEAWKAVESPGSSSQEERTGYRPGGGRRSPSAVSWSAPAAPVAPSETMRIARPRTALGTIPNRASDPAACRLTAPVERRLKVGEDEVGRAAASATSAPAAVTRASM
jgi:hypothetical protein